MSRVLTWVVVVFIVVAGIAVAALTLGDSISSSMSEAGDEISNPQPAELPPEPTDGSDDGSTTEPSPPPEPTNGSDDGSTTEPAQSSSEPTVVDGLGAPTGGVQLPDLGGIFSSEKEPEEGVGRFVDPGPMVLGSWYPLRFVAAPDVSATVMEVPDANLTAPQPVYLSRTMRVTLLPDPNFESLPANDAVQNTGRDLTQTWQWSVKPIHDGVHNLTAKVEAGELRKDGTFDAWDSRVRTVSIRVKIGTWDGFVRALGRASSAGDLFATVFASWEKTLTALAALITASGAVWLAMREWGKREKAKE